MTETRDLSVASQSAGEILDRLEHFGVRLGLDRIRALLTALGDPQLRLKTVLVAGTNGKGSTAAFLAAMVGAAGYRVGLYTSPHLESPRERIRVDGGALAEAELQRQLARIVEVSTTLTGHEPTYFEALTAAAYLHFLEHRVDLAILEVGMGGRLDATNTAEPELAIITPIAVDHAEHLGPTRAAIAVEKAGILRAGRPAVVWYDDAETGGALRAAAAARSTTLTNVAEQVTLVPIDASQVELIAPRRSYRLRPALRGDHQHQNLALAVVAAETLCQAGWQRLGPRAIRQGAAACRWPGRLEEVPLRRGRVLLDAAHNPAGARAVAEYLRRRGEPMRLLFGSLRNKQADVVLPQLADHATDVVLTSPPSDRAVAPDHLAELVSSLPIVVQPSWREALDCALADLRDRTLFVSGSLYLVGAIRAELHRRFGIPVAAVDIVTGPGGESCSGDF